MGKKVVLEEAAHINKNLSLIYLAASAGAESL
jgi:hypothetical protein